MSRTIVFVHGAWVTPLCEFPGRSPWIVAREGWQEVATDIGLWLESPRISRTA